MSAVAVLSAVLLVIVALPVRRGRAGRAGGVRSVPRRDELLATGAETPSAVRTESLVRRWERVLGVKVGGLVLWLVARNRTQVDGVAGGGAVVGGNGRTGTGVGTDSEVSAVADKRLWIGRATAYALLLLPVSRPGSLIVGTILLALPVFRRRRRTREAEAALLDSLPDVIDLLAIAVAAGCNLRLAIEAVAVIIPGAARAPLAEVCGRVSRGQRLGDALVVLHDLPGYQGLAAALIDAERYGTPLARALDGLALEARALRRRRAEEAARRLPITLLFPLVLCVLPAFALLTVIPLLAGSLLSLRL